MEEKDGADTDADDGDENGYDHGNKGIRWCARSCRRRPPRRRPGRQRLITGHPLHLQDVFVFFGFKSDMHRIMTNRGRDGISHELMSKPQSSTMQILPTGTNQRPNRDPTIEATL